MREINSLKMGEAAGPDRIIPEFIKTGSEYILPIFTKILNALFITGNIPIEWSQSMVEPLFKKGDRNVTDNYRGISLSSN
jgi:hypothetical protein